MIKNNIKDLPYRRCVGAALFNSKGEVWVGKRIVRSKTSLKQVWQMPQGGIEKGEKPEVAVIRELKEETGIDQVEIISEVKRWLKYDLPLHLARRSWEGRYRGQEQKWFALRYLGNDDDFYLDKHTCPEFSDWRWVALEELVKLAVYFKRDIYQVVVMNFNHIPKLLTSHKT